jgi:penicillin amidase
MRRFQTDPGSARADAFVPQFLGAAAREDSAGRGDAALRRAEALLAEWDRRYTKDNKRAVLFEMAMDELRARTWDELRPQRDKDTTAQALTLPESQVLLELLHEPASKWWDDTRTTNVIETRDAIIAGSLRAALAGALKSHGDPSGDGWLWSKVRHANIYHLAQIPALSALDIPVQGGPSTLSPSGGSGREGASWRMVVELGPDVRAWATYPGGQSGNPASPRYKDRLPLWENGKLAPVLFPRTRADIDPKRVVSVLRLDPR